jgi:uncharacterized membrane protein YqhA
MIIEHAIERVLFATRWLLAPFYLALAVGLIALLVKTGERVYELVMGFLGLRTATCGFSPLST